ncbi:hypothetical protein PMIN01_00519 [Paraphaeosphaeria minitans]|uniref:Uncharacterized protein n=1 Tax=Paraphaeosphaeria minitans TaxID=565426 RepID=A0A9P6KW28_9PLEO|nr:hypothetical protein PMIN01_00519 [Paraphaeosphaeria minitans]
MQQRRGSLQRNGNANSTSQRVQPYSSDIIYDRVSANGEHVNHQHSSSQSRNTRSSGYTFVHSCPAVLHHYQQRSNKTQGWQAVPRSWTQASPEVLDSTSHPALDRNLVVQPSNRGVSLHGDNARATSNRLTLAELDRLNGQHARMDAMNRWRSESQRDGAWNGIGHVRSTGDGSLMNAW